MFLEKCLYCTFSAVGTLYISTRSLRKGLSLWKSLITKFWKKTQKSYKQILADTDCLTVLLLLSTLGINIWVYKNSPIFAFKNCSIIKTTTAKSFKPFGLNQACKTMFTEKGWNLTFSKTTILYISFKSLRKALYL